MFIEALLFARLWGHSSTQMGQGPCGGLVMKGGSRDASYKPFAVVQARENDSLD